MAKISSYPSDANVTTSDRLIGSDNENSNETKNFEIGDIINLAASIILPQVASVYVPYAGATSDVILGTNEIYAGAGYFPDIYTTNINPNIGVSLISIGADVDLGAYTLSTSYLTSSLGIFIDGVNGAISLDGDEGLTGEFLVSQGPGATPSWTNPSSVFVPYTGATANVDLGAYDIDADAASFSVVNTDDIYSSNLFAFGVNPNIFVGNDALQPVGLLIDTSTNFFALGDVYSQFNGTKINIEDGSSRITFVGGFNLSNGQGTAGQVLTSAGAGITPVWAALPSLTGFVPYTGATGGVNLGIYSLTATNVNANNFVPIVGGTGNTFFGGAGGYGVAQNGVYCTLGVGLIPDITILGNSLPGSGTKIEIDATNTSISFLNGNVNLGGTNGLILLNGTGSAGQVLICSGSGTAPLWSSAPGLATSTFWKGNFYDSITQTLAAANTATPVILSNTDAPTTNSISIVTDGTNLSRITFANAGVYNILFSAQLANSGGTAQTVDFWLRKNGSTFAANIPHTNGKVQLQGNATFLMAAWNYFVDVAAGDYIQLVWAATSTNVTMVAAAANGVHPETPSIIVTANVV